MSHFKTKLMQTTEMHVLRAAVEMDYIGQTALE